MCEVADIAQMIAQIAVNSPQDIGIWAPRRVGLQSRIDLLVKKFSGHLPVELAVKPVNEPSNLGALLPVSGKKWHFEPIYRMPLQFICNVFRNCIGAAEQGPSIDLQHRQLSGRIELQELVADVPGLLFDGLHFQPEFRQRNADGAGQGTEPEVPEPMHLIRLRLAAAAVFRSILRQSALLCRTAGRFVKGTSFRGIAHSRSNRQCGQRAAAVQASCLRGRQFALPRPNGCGHCAGIRDPPSPPPGSHSAATHRACHRPRRQPEMIRVVPWRSNRSS